MLSRAKPLNAGVDVMGRLERGFAGSAAPTPPPKALNQTIREAYEAQSVALQAAPAELYHRDHH
jgi:hypothetical protein